MFSPFARRRAFLFAAGLCLLLCRTAHSGITTIGNVTPDPHTTTASDELRVGNTADGMMVIDADSDVVARRSYIGFDAGASGFAAVSGAGSTWTNAQGLAVGVSGTGILNITGGGSVNSVGASLGNGPQALGVATVSGSGSAWINSGWLYVGGDGAGTLAITGGGEVSDSRGVVGFAPGSRGTVTVDGTDSRWTTKSSLSVGTRGTGTLGITGGAAVTCEYAFLGDLPGSTGTAMVSGPASTWSLNYLAVGGQGTGTLAVTGGGRVEFAGDGRIAASPIAIAVGASPGSTGRVTVADPGSTMFVDGIAVGEQGTGTLLIAGGGTIACDHASLGAAIGSTGTATVAGIGSTWISYYLTVGDAGAGTLAITGGGHIILLPVPGFDGLIPGISILGARYGSTGDATVDGPGSLLSSGYLYVGYESAGTLSVTGGGMVTSEYSQIGRQPDSEGTVTIDGPGSSWTNDTELVVGSYGAGAVNVTGGGTVDAGFRAYVGDNAGATGRVTVDGAGSTWRSRDLYVGRYGGHGEVTVSGGGRLISSRVFVGGIGGFGSLHITDGGQVITTGSGRETYISLGTATIDGDGSSWTIAGSLLISGEASPGTLRIDGGIVDVAQDLYLGNASPFPASDGIGMLELAGGRLRLHNGEIVGGATGAFEFTGGRLEGASTIDLGRPLVQQGGVLVSEGPFSSKVNGGYTLDQGAFEFNLHSLSDLHYLLFSVNGTIDLVGDNGLLDGMLNVMLGFDPTLGDEYLVIGNDGTDPVIGMFATGVAVKAPYGESLYRFGIDYAAGDGNDISLIAQSVSLLGDYNGDGMVDGADYGAWQDALGSRVAPYFGADGSGDGIVNEADYDVWKEHFGATGGSRLLGATVPEPAGLALMMLGVLSAVAFRRR